MGIKYLLICLLFIYRANAQRFSVLYCVKNADQVNIASLRCDDRYASFNCDFGDSDTKVGSDFFVKDRTTPRAFFTMRFMDVTFYVEDSLYNFHWQLEPDTSTILGLHCQAALTDFRGRQYKAFYAPGFPVSEGPWKFGGLPGLILQVQSTDNFIEYTATQILQGDRVGKPITMIPDKIFLSWADFVREYKKTVWKFIKLTRSSGSLSDDASAILKITSAELFYPELQTGNGIKF